VTTADHDGIDHRIPPVVDSVRRDPELLWGPWPLITPLRSRVLSARRPGSGSPGPAPAAA
jgi:hypothetical protein